MNPASGCLPSPVSVAFGWERTGELDFLPPFYGEVALAYALPARRVPETAR
jgi:hypothetical protein